MENRSVIVLRTTFMRPRVFTAIELSRVSECNSSCRQTPMTPLVKVLSLGAGRGYVTLIAELEGPEGALLTSLLIHCPVSWLTLSGLLMSWGLVPTGFRCGTGFIIGGGGTGGVSGHGQGLAKLEGDGNTSDGLARLDNADKPPGLLRDSSSSGVPASPTLPKLSSE